MIVCPLLTDHFILVRPSGSSAHATEAIATCSRLAASISSTRMHVGTRPREFHTIVLCISSHGGITCSGSRSSCNRV